MTPWLLLAGAIVSEVAATLSLRAAATPGSRRSWYAVVVTGYALAFGLLSLTLHAGLGLGVAYGVWAAAGIALTAVASRVLFREPLTVLMSVGIAVIVGGVVLLEIGR